MVMRCTFTIGQTKRNPGESRGSFFYTQWNPRVDLRGIEPLTSGMQSRCSTN